MSDVPGIVYRPRPEATPEIEATTLATIYGFVLACHAKKNAVVVTSNDGDDAKEGSLNDSRAKTSIP